MRLDAGIQQHRATHPRGIRSRQPIQQVALCSRMLLVYNANVEDVPYRQNSPSFDSQLLIAIQLAEVRPVDNQPEGKCTPADSNNCIMNGVMSKRSWTMEVLS
eukprot:TRINITY_DN10874_c0_g1_i8.p2 TRINITY_DN10874_c0_g1~~TRINITY_DN10874_c0_g1_i8.p2  ORF type:complete len:103 (-),score=2.36 TRINITY_DN10874_c0_g1_i8:78-386(-)